MSRFVRILNKKLNFILMFSSSLRALLSANVAKNYEKMSRWKRRMRLLCLSGLRKKASALRNQTNLAMPFQFVSGDGGMEYERYWNCGAMPLTEWSVGKGLAVLSHELIFQKVWWVHNKLSLSFRYLLEKLFHWWTLNSQDRKEISKSLKLKCNGNCTSLGALVLEGKLIKFHS